MIRSLIGGAFVGATFLICFSAGATTYDQDFCKIYFEGDPGVPKNIEFVLRRNKSRAVEGCFGRNKKLSRYNVLSPVTKGRFDVCSYQATGPYVHGIQSLQTQTYLTQTSGTCPRQGEKSYVPTSGVSAGVFVSLTRFSDRLLSSDKNSEPYFEGHVPENLRREKVVILSKFLAAAKGAKLRAIFVREPGAVADATQGYELSFWNETIPRILTIYVDLTAQGFKILDLSVRNS